MVENLIFILLIFMLLGSLIALEAKDLLSSVVSIGAVGFMLSVVFLFLKAPDIAIVQVVVEILTLIILIRATISRDTLALEDEREFLPFGVIIILLLIFSAFSYKALEFLPQLGVNLSQVAPHYLTSGLKETGAANIVSSVILDYRAYDTMGEATILFTALMGAAAILRRKAKR
ncbi:MAG: hydrogen gas-evolving membrane-bound hydrogenase subunit E [bacterium]